jgi:hypothetical protein
MFLPIAVADDSDALAGARFFLLGEKGASVSRQHTEHREVIGADDVHNCATKVSLFA